MNEQQLQPDFWINNKLNPDIRIKLLKIAEAFYKNSEIDLTVKDILFSGSMAGYNYNNTSDIDLHLVFNFKDIDDNTVLVRNWLLGKASKWNLDHNITLKGYKVNIYTEDVLDKDISNGIYSILNDKWIQKPEKNDLLNTDVTKVDEIATKISNHIDKIKTFFETNAAEDTAVKVTEMLKKLSQKLKNMRQTSLDLYGVDGIGNLVFKKLRNNGYLETIKTVYNQAYDKVFTENKINENLTLNEVKIRKDIAANLYDKKLEFPDLGVVIFYTIKPDGKYHAAGFLGKDPKARFHYSFGTKERFDEYVAEYIDRIRRNNETLRLQKEKVKNDAKNLYDKIQVGDVIYTSWGYEQTNIDFYQVTSKFGTNSLKIRQIADKDVTKNNSGISNMAGYKIPIKDKFIGDEQTIRISRYLRVDNRYADLWDGEAKYYSWYA